MCFIVMFQRLDRGPNLCWIRIKVDVPCGYDWFDPFMPSGFLYFNSLDKFISYIRGGLVRVLLLALFTVISLLNATSLGPDQTLRPLMGRQAGQSQIFQ